MAFEVEPVRARIGLIIPSSNRLSEPQFRRYAPPGVEIHVTRLRMTGRHHVPLPELMPRIAEAALTLADADCRVIVFHCTGSAMADGADAERAVIDNIGQVTGRIATTTASAILEAFRAVAARKIVLISPYTRETNDHEIAFLAEHGIETLRQRALDLPPSDGYIAAPPSLWLDVALEERDPQADAYFLSCTNIRSPEVIEPLEAELGRPVIGSNQATLWHCLRLCGFDDVVPGLGQLFRIRAGAASAA